MLIDNDNKMVNPKTGNAVSGDLSVYDALYGPWNSFKELADTITKKDNTDTEVENFLKFSVKPGVTVCLFEDGNLVEYWKSSEEVFTKRDAKVDALENEVINNEKVISNSLNDLNSRVNKINNESEAKIQGLINASIAPLATKDYVDDELEEVKDYLRRRKIKWTGVELSEGTKQYYIYNAGTRTFLNENEVSINSEHIRPTLWSVNVSNNNTSITLQSDKSGSYLYLNSPSLGVSPSINFSTSPTIDNLSDKYSVTDGRFNEDELKLFEGYYYIISQTSSNSTNKRYLAVNAGDLKNSAHSTDDKYDSLMFITEDQYNEKRPLIN